MDNWKSYFCNCAYLGYFYKLLKGERKYEKFTNNYLARELNFKVEQIVFQVI